MQRQIVVAVEEAFEAHQHSNEESMFGVLQPLSSRCCTVVSFKSDAIEKHDFFFANIVLCQRISVLFLVHTILRESSDGSHVSLVLHA